LAVHSTLRGSIWRSATLDAVQHRGPLWFRNLGKQNDDQQDARMSAEKKPGAQV
jgi:hypothetical protein